MPLRETQDPALSANLQDAKEEYLIFYSSRDEAGKLWCPVSLRHYRDMYAVALGT